MAKEDGFERMFRAGLTKERNFPLLNNLLDILPFAEQPLRVGQCPLAEAVWCWKVKGLLFVHIMIGSEAELDISRVNEPPVPV
jgi:hypothetical protein